MGNTQLKGKIHMLVVDDEADLLELMRLHLERQGYKVETCWNGENIKSMINTNPPDIVLLDVKMDNVDGEDICKMIKTGRKTHNIKVILFSANHNIKSIANRCGADGVLTKPFDTILANETFMQVLR